MNVAALRPGPTNVQHFRRDRLNFVPATSGCYVLAALDGCVLYAGLTINLRARMEQHLDTPEKRAVTRHGRALHFHWLETEALAAVERGWLNSHVALTGELPILNKVASAMSS